MQTCQNCKYRDLGVCGALSLGEGTVTPVYKSMRPGSVLVRPRVSSGLQILCSGYAIKYITMSDGKRQILSLRRPGLAISGCLAHQAANPFYVLALTDVQIAQVDKAALKTALDGHPTLFQEMAHILEAETAELSELAIDLGRRDAAGRIAHLVLKFLAWTGSSVSDNQARVRIPLRQDDIADFTGLTPTHVNRTLADLRRRKLLRTVGDIFVVDDVEALRQLVK